MTFFQDYPIPAMPPRPRMPEFVPPPWSGPPRYELPAIVPVGRFLHRSAGRVVAVESVSAYSTGCTINLTWTIRRTDEDDQEWAVMNAGFFNRFGPPGPSVSGKDIFLFGVELPDGTRASISTVDQYAGPPMGQEPEGPVFTFRSGGGHGGDHDLSVTGTLWLWPLPPAGDLRLVTQWTAMGIEESSITLDGAALRDAAMDAQAYWPDGTPE